MTRRKTSQSRSIFGIFARAPVPGQTKTRLIPRLGPDRAAQFHQCALLDTIEQVRACGFPARLFLTPMAAASRMTRLGVELPILSQGRGNLGTRMGRALQDLLALRGVDHALLLGTDSPDLPVSILEEAMEALDRSDVVLAPAFDGGFTLIGVSQRIVRGRGRGGERGREHGQGQRQRQARSPLVSLLDGIPWSAPDTLTRTVARLIARGHRPELVTPWWDVDEPADLDRLEERLQIARLLGQPLPRRTSEFLGHPRA